MCQIIWQHVSARLWQLTCRQETIKMNKISKNIYQEDIEVNIDAWNHKRCKVSALPPKSDAADLSVKHQHMQERLKKESLHIAMCISFEVTELHFSHCNLSILIQYNSVSQSDH